MAHLNLANPVASVTGGEAPKRFTPQSVTRQADLRAVTTCDVSHPVTLSRSEQDRRPRSSWPEERTEKLKRLFDEGKSYLLIAREMGTSKNVIGNKIDRLGWTRPETVVVAVQDRSGATARRPAVKRTTSGPLGLALPLWELENNGCRFPTSEARDGTHLFCGEPQAIGRCYCAAHHARATRVVPFDHEAEADKADRRDGKMRGRSDGAKCL